MARPLPGITFQAVPPDLADKLPRMDVAAFVGFAAAGPLHTPVVVEDEVHFRRIFGDDLALAWDEAAGAVHRSYLGAAVRAFFRNGGRRCWVVRVASDQAVANRFLLPGLMRADSAGFLRAAPVRARAEGSWSDDLRTGTTLTADPLVLKRFDRHGDVLTIELSRLSSGSLAAGDLLRFTFPQAVLYLVVEQAEAAGPVWRVAGAEHWFKREPSFTAKPSGLDVWIRRPEGRRRRLKGARWFPPPQAGSEHRICLPGGGAGTTGIGPVTPGCLLEIETDNYPTFLLSVLESRAAAEAELSELNLGAGAWTVLAGRDPLGPTTRRVGHALAWGVQEEKIRVERLTFALWVQEGDAQPYHLDGLGFSPDHPRYLGALPADVRLFGAAFHAAKPRPDGPAPGERLWPSVIDPRFPLAGEVDGLYLPIGMPFQMGTLAPPLETGVDPALRNGMAAFDPGVFLDPDLEGLTSDALREAIFQKHDVLGEDLKGLHALWPLDEVTLVALPDAIHPPWAEDVADVILPPPAPFLNLDKGLLTWTAIATATGGYLVQIGGDPAFEGSTRSVPISQTELKVPTEAGCPETRYYRVRAIREDQPGPWSNTIRILLDASDFEACQPVTYLDPPELQEPVALGDHRYALKWSAVSGSVTYTLEEAEDPDFFGARELVAGTATEITTVRTGDKPAYYRVRAESADLVSPWSRTVWLLEGNPRVVKKLQPEQADPQDQLRIHDAALRMALARGDLLTVLILPARAREEETVTYVRSLIARTEEQALTYGAVYHPWTWVQEEGEAPRLLPPDGAVTGQMARRALERGAWVAPANMDMAGVVALAPTLTPAAWQLFADNQINLVMRDPRGFLTLSADTLSQDPDLRLINVRRLLILLRRLALREGAAMVFQPNDETFRRLVQRRFEALLSDMYVRGAFAGDSVDQAFRVVTDASVNPRQSVEAGRFVVELRVAPSQPLAFLTVRLIQTQGAGPTFQEV